MKNIKYILSIITVLTIVCGAGSVAMADKDKEIISEEVIEINAEDIGIKEINNNLEDEELIEEDVIESNDEFVDESIKPNIDNEPVTESPTPPEGKVEKYIVGDYSDPNENDCDIDEECYDCEDDSHMYVHCVSMENDTYIYEEWCEVCGHGTEKIITKNEFNTLGVETDVEF